MSKRFLDTGIWERPWFMELEPADKMAIMYLFAKCDAVGVWVPNFKLADFQLKATVDWDGLLGKCNGNIRVLEGGKWFLPDFVTFQYGELDEGCRPHRAYIALLEKHGLKGYGYPIDRVKDKDKELDKDKDKDKEEVAEGVRLRQGEQKALVERFGTDKTVAAYTLLSNYKLSSGHKYKSDYHAILNWVIDEVKKRSPPGREKTPGWVCSKCGYENHNTGGVCGKCKEVRE